MPKFFRKTIYLVLVFFILLTGLSPLTYTSYAETIPISPYVSAHGTNLYLNGTQYQFTGVNAFNLGTDPGINAGCGGSIADLDAFFSHLRPNSMIRMWAFQGTIATNVKTKQIDWTGLDRVVAAAQKDNIKLILVLGDQAGACDDGHWRDPAWYQSGYTQAINDYGNGLTPIPYLDYVKLIVTHYKSSTAVAMWEPINEPEAAGCQSGQGTACYAHQTCNEPVATQAMRSFFDAVGGAIKSIDPNHLVASGVGGDGQCGAIYGDFQNIHAGSGIDVATYHDYDRNDQAMPGDPWNGLQERITQMKNLNKPLIIEEAGMIAGNNMSGCMSNSSRRDDFKAKMDAQFKSGIAGYMVWDLTGGDVKDCNYSIGDNDPTLTLLHNYPTSMGLYVDTQAPTAPTNLTATVNATKNVVLNWTASSDNVGVVRYDIFRNNAYFSSTTDTSIIDTNASPSGTYTYFVKGKDAANNISHSSTIVILTLPK
ncbi:MAG TPA: cellulase family glycosylhydrolase [Candidatus Saccharimonadales bacterium]|nr:cellulase family glycosylhydrolase [Candidatus Saccharimonadales bacterium]